MPRRDDTFTRSVPAECIEWAEGRISFLLDGRALSLARFNLRRLLVNAYAQGLADADELHRRRLIPETSDGI